MAKKYLVRCCLGALLLADSGADATELMKHYIKIARLNNMSMDGFVAMENDGRNFVPNIRVEGEELAGDIADARCHDMVNSPSHYCQGGVECIDALAAATVNLKGIEAVCTANAIKYLWRWKEKNGKEDLLKAQWYINRLVAELEMVAELENKNDNS